MTIETYSGYCGSYDKLISRLTMLGEGFVVDRNDGDGTISDDEINRYLIGPMNRADAMIDAALSPHLEPNFARGQGNQWLENMGLDLAVFYSITLGGRDAPDSTEKLYDDALTALERVRSKGYKVPNLLYPTPAGTLNRPLRHSGVPRICNPRTSRR